MRKIEHLTDDLVKFRRHVFKMKDELERASRTKNHHRQACFDLIPWGEHDTSEGAYGRRSSIHGIVVVDKLESAISLTDFGKEVGEVA